MSISTCTPKFKDDLRRVKLYSHFSSPQHSPSSSLTSPSLCTNYQKRSTIRGIKILIETNLKM